MENKYDYIQFYCSGCGLPLQNGDPNKPGYTPKRLEKNGPSLCQRCFRLQHYGEQDESIDKDRPVDYSLVLYKAMQKKSLIIFVIDLFSFELSFIEYVLKQMKGARIVVVATKRDIIPSAVSDTKLRNYIFERLKEYDIRPLDVLVSSALKNYNLDEIIERCTELRHKRDVYLFGATSVGKSSLVNALFKIYNNKTQQVISTSPYPGTTLDVISIPLDEKTYLFDTPGIVLKESIYHILDPKLIPLLLPRNEIKPRTFQLKSEQSFFVENFCKIDFLDNIENNVTFYMSNELFMHRCKLEKSVSVFHSMIMNNEIPHMDEKIHSISDLQYIELDLPENEIDVVIVGLLWFKLIGKGQKIRVFTPKGVEVKIRKCRI